MLRIALALILVSAAGCASVPSAGNRSLSRSDDNTSLNRSGDTKSLSRQDQPAPRPGVPSSHPLLGTWILDDSAMDLELGAWGKMTFHRDGTRESRFQWYADARLFDNRDRFYVRDGDVYAGPQGQEEKFLYEIRGVRMFVTNADVPGTLVFRRK